MSLSRHDKSILLRAALPEALREPVQNWLAGIRETSGFELSSLATSGDDQLTLVRLVASSEFAANALARDIEWFAAALKSGRFAAAEIDAATIAIPAGYGASADDIVGVKTHLRKQRQRGQLQILWRSFAGLDTQAQMLDQLSRLADCLVSICIEYAQRALTCRFGTPRSSDGQKIDLITLAMGKLGGSELNFSSDIDLIFLYTDEGETSGPRTLSAHEYFARLTRQVVNLLDEMTADGFVYRVDTRLRPFGESGPPVVSCAALEDYLLQHGRSWERYAYVKARAIGPSANAHAVTELQASVIEPFVYRRYLDFGVFESLRDMKALILAEVKRRELQDNIKLGPGGIREIEFIAQSLQLVRGGADPQLRCRELRSALTRLRHSRSLDRATVSALLESYDFLRKLENSVQAIRDQQTHDLPGDFIDQARLLVAMGFSSWESLLAKLAHYRDSVSETFAEVVFRTESPETGSEFAAQLLAQWSAASSAADWSNLLRENDFVDADKLADTIVEFSAGAILRQIDVAGQKRLARFMCALLLLLRDKRRPDVVCQRVLAVVSQILRRSAYVALLNENPAGMDRLVSLCEQSAYLAKEIARYPLLLDELLDPRLYTAEISTAAMQADLNERLGTADPDDSERCIEVLAQFQRATLFRIAVADIGGNLPIMKVSDRLTDLAEIVLARALDIAWSDLVRLHGLPVVATDDGYREAGFGVIAYGKLGGIELSYKSDLDLVFLHNTVGDSHKTNGDRPLENSMFFARLVRRLVHFLTVQTGSGALYEVDTRLRPSGRSGLLVVNTEGFERYQEENAWTWEHQALLRGRPVAGSAAVARDFERIRIDTLCNRVHSADLRNDVISMRQKMRQQLDASNAGQFDLKQGEGGIADIEFLVQFLLLRNARTEPALIYYSDNIRQLGALEAVGILSALDVNQLQSAYKAYRLRTHRLALNGRKPLVPADEFLDERRVVVTLWQREMHSPDEH